MQSDNIAIKVDNISKVYPLYNSPRDRLKEALHPIRKKYHKDFYALNDVSFEIKKGETVGIIGQNGSGKSNLLEFIDSSIFSEKLPELMKKYVLADDFSYTVEEKDKIFTKITIKTKSISQTANTINGHISKNNLSAKTLFIESTNTDN